MLEQWHPLAIQALELHLRGVEGGRAGSRLVLEERVNLRALRGGDDPSAPLRLPRMPEDVVLLECAHDGILAAARTRQAMTTRSDSRCDLMSVNSGRALRAVQTFVRTAGTSH